MKTLISVVVDIVALLLAALLIFMPEVVSSLYFGTLIFVLLIKLAFSLFNLSALRAAETPSTKKDDDNKIA